MGCRNWLLLVRLKDKSKRKTKDEILRQSRYMLAEQHHSSRQLRIESSGNT